MKQPSCSLTWQSVHVDTVSGQTDAHVTVAALAHYLHLEIVEAAGSGNRMGGLDAGCVPVCLSMACENKTVNYLMQIQ